MALKNWISNLVGKPLIDVAPRTSTKGENQTQRTIAALTSDLRSPIELAPTVKEVNLGTLAEGIRVGDVHFSYFEKTKDFHSLALYYSPEVMLTPGYPNACALYQAIKLGLIARNSEILGADFERRTKEVGADWSYLRLLEVEGKRKLWISRGDLTLHADCSRLVKLFFELQAAVQQAGLDPDVYFALPH